MDGYGTTIIPGKPDRSLGHPANWAFSMYETYLPHMLGPERHPLAQVFCCEEHFPVGPDGERYIVVKEEAYD